MIAVAVCHVLRSVLQNTSDAHLPKEHGPPHTTDADGDIDCLVSSPFSMATPPALFQRVPNTHIVCMPLSASTKRGLSEDLKDDRGNFERGREEGELTISGD